MAALDPAVELAAVQASIASITTQLNTGVTQQSDGIRMLKFDMATLQGRLDVLLARQAVLLGCAPQVRRVYVFQPSKGL